MRVQSRKPREKGYLLPIIQLSAFPVIIQKEFIEYLVKLELFERDFQKQITFNNLTSYTEAWEDLVTKMKINDLLSYFYHISSSVVDKESCNKFYDNTDPKLLNIFVDRLLASDFR